MTARIVSIASVVPYGENLTVVTTSENEVVIANRKEDGSFRWEPGEVAIFIAEGSIIPDEVLKDRGYWDEEKDRGLLDGGKRNRVKARKWGPDKIVASGLLFKTHALSEHTTVNVQIEDAVAFVSNPHAGTSEWHAVIMGQDVSDVLGITEQGA